MSTISATRPGQDLATLEQQSVLYSLLARAMNYPDTTLFSMLRDGDMRGTLLGCFGAVHPGAMSAEIESLSKECAASLHGDPEQALLNLERDYTRMFYASKPRLAYLFESVYREGRLLQESTFQVARLYQDAGLSLSEEFRLPLDHIAVELEFLSFLFHKQVESARAGDGEGASYAVELQEILLRDHLVAFALEVAARMTKHARHPMYRLVAILLDVSFRNCGIAAKRQEKIQ